MSKKVDLSVTFSGIKFENPFIVSSAPPTRTAEMIERAFEAGWAGVSVKTATPDYRDLVDVQPRLKILRTPAGNPYGIQNIELLSTRPLEDWAKDIAMLRKKYPNKVIISSITAPPMKEKWQEATEILQDAGAMAIEINGSCPHGMPERGEGSYIGQSPELAVRVVSWVKEVAKVPVWFKLTPNVTDIGAIAEDIAKAGIDAFSAINTVIGLGSIDIDTFVPEPNVEGRSTFGGHSGPLAKPIALRAIVEVARRTGKPVSGQNGIQTWEDAVQFMLAGSGTVQCCSVIMWKGYGVISEFLNGMTQYLEKKGFSSPMELVGKSLPFIGRHTQLSRTFKVVPVVDGELCDGCEDCYIACRDGGFQAIRMEGNKPVINLEECSGCNLCAQVCHRGYIKMVPRQ